MYISPPYHQKIDVDQRQCPQQASDYFVKHPVFHAIVHLTGINRLQSIGVSCQQAVAFT